MENPFDVEIKLVIGDSEMCAECTRSGHCTSHIKGKVQHPDDCLNYSHPTLS